MAKNFKQEMVCLWCLYGNIQNEISLSKKEQLEQKLWNKDDKSVYKDYYWRDYEFNEIKEDQKGNFLGQVGDFCYFIWQGYEYSVSKYPYHYIMFESKLKETLDVRADV